MRLFLFLFFLGFFIGVKHFFYVVTGVTKEVDEILVINNYLHEG